MNTYFNTVKITERKRAMTQVQVTSNAPSVEEYLAKIKSNGADCAKGGDSQITSALLVLEGGYHGRFDLQPNKHGNGIDDADLLAKEFGAGYAQHALFNAKGKSFGKIKSNNKKMIKFGTSPQWGTGQPLAAVNDFVDAWRALRKNNTKGLDDCYNALMKYATAQLKEPQLITGAALDKFFYKSTREEPTAAEIINNAVKTLHKLTLGKAPGCKEVDSSAEVKAAITSLNKRLTNIAQSVGSVTQAA